MLIACSQLRKTFPKMIVREIMIYAFPDIYYNSLELFTYAESKNLLTGSKNVKFTTAIENKNLRIVKYLFPTIDVHFMFDLFIRKSFNYKCFDIFMFLYENGANIYTLDCYIFTCALNGGKKVFKLIYDIDPEKTKSMMIQNNQYRHLKFFTEREPLFYKECVKKIIEKNQIVWLDMLKNAPVNELISYANSYKSIKIVRNLLEKDANVNCISTEFFNSLLDQRRFQFAGNLIKRGYIAKQISIKWYDMVHILETAEFLIKNNISDIEDLLFKRAMSYVHLKCNLLSQLKVYLIILDLNNYQFAGVDVYGAQFFGFDEREKIYYKEHVNESDPNKTELEINIEYLDYWHSMFSLSDEFEEY